MQWRKWAGTVGLTNLSRRRMFRIGLFLLALALVSTALGRPVFSLFLEKEPTLGTLAVQGPVDGPPVPALIPPISAEQSAMEPTYTGCGGINAPVVNAAYEQEVIDRVNDVRETHGLPPLKWVSALNNSARYHATDMGQDDYFDHDSYDRQGGALVKVCAWSTRIQSYYANWLSLAENIAAGYATPADVMAGWMNSTGHRNNILSEGNWEIGAGFYQGSGDWGRYWVQNFGRRRNVYPLVINREAATADSPDVSLYIYGDWDEIRLRNDGGSWTSWQPFQSTMNWRLYWSRGERTVWAEMRAGSRTAASSDTIYLTTGSPILGNLPDTLWFIYSRAEGRLLPASHELTPQNVGNNDALSWTVTPQGTWFAVDPVHGTTPGSFSITPTTFNTGSPNTYTGSATVTVSDPAACEDSPHQITLTLKVIDGPLFQSYLPLISH